MIGIIVLIWFAYLLCVPRHIPLVREWLYTYLPQELFAENGHINPSVLGDYFGALTCLFSGLAFAAVFVSIKQQSKSIKIQQNELRAQLQEMSNNVQEAREQTKLQIKYQFSEEFYRRIHLLKTLENNISYNKKKGLDAIVPLASDISKFLTFIVNNDVIGAHNYYQSQMHNIRVALDKFKVWTHTLLALTEDISEHHKAQAAYEKRRTKDEQEYSEIDAEAQKAILHYQTILIASTIWAEQYLLLHLCHALDDKRLDILTSHSQFARGARAKLAKNKRLQHIFREIYYIDKSKEAKAEITRICDEHQAELHPAPPEELAHS